jgi:hypothetical protein
MPPLETKLRKIKQEVDPLTGERAQRRWKGVAIVLIIVVVAAAAVFYFKKNFQKHSNILDTLNSDSSESASTSKLAGKYQAVFLDNGQVYFGTVSIGKLTSDMEGWLRLENVFYFKQTQAPQSDVTKSDVSLSKLGSEVHGPDDFMEINPEHVLFVEDLKETSQVVKAIQEYEKKTN